MRDERCTGRPCTRHRLTARAGSTLTGTGSLVRFILRRYRLRLSLWTASMVLFYAYFTVALDTVFADEAPRQGRAAVMKTPAGIVMGGPG